MKQSYILGSIVILALVLVSCVPPDPEQLVGFWKIDQVFFWDEGKKGWVQDTDARSFYNEFRKGGRNCPRSEGRMYVSVIPSEVCYFVDKNLLVERGSTALKEYRWSVRGNTLEIISEMELGNGAKVKVKTLSIRATKEDAFRDGFPYKNPLVVEEVEK